MDLKQLKKWVNDLPENELDNYNLVFRTIKELDNENWGAYDIPIAACGVDEGNKEVYFCNEKSAQILILFIVYNVLQIYLGAINNTERPLTNNVY